MADKEMSSIFTRVGNKKAIKNKLYSMFPTDFKVYVEPYVGGGSVFMGYSFKPEQKIIINDIEKDLIKSYRFIKSNPSIVGTEKYDSEEKTKLESLIQSGKGKSGFPGFVSFVIRYANSFGGTGSNTVAKNISVSPYYRIKRIPEQAEKLKNITILNQDALTVIKKYNRPDVFLYLDPPYENSKTLYENDTIQYEKLADILKTFKGKWLLSVNSSNNIKKLFVGYKIATINVKGGGHGQGAVGSSIRKEFLIKNY
jgi:DNA adenine methylase